MEGGRQVSESLTKRIRELVSEQLGVDAQGLDAEANIL